MYFTNHPFDDPGWVGTLRLDGHAIVEGDTEVGATADQHGNRIRVRRELGQKNRSAFQRVRATGKEARNGTGHVGENCDSGEGRWVKKARLVVVSCHHTSIKQLLAGNRGVSDAPAKMRPLGRTWRKGYRLLGFVRSSQSMNNCVLPPGMRGRISSVGLAGAFEPVSPPTTRTLPLDRTSAVGYQRPLCMRMAPSEQTNGA